MFIKRTPKAPTLNPQQLADVARRLGSEPIELDSRLHDETAADRLFAHEANRSKGKHR